MPTDIVLIEHVHDIDIDVEMALRGAYKCAGYGEHHHLDMWYIPELHDLAIEVAAESEASMRSEVAFENFPYSGTSDIEDYIEKVNSGELDEELDIDADPYTLDNVRAAIVVYMTHYQMFYRVMVSNYEHCFVNIPIKAVW